MKQINKIGLLSPNYLKVKFHTMKCISSFSFGATQMHDLYLLNYARWSAEYDEMPSVWLSGVLK